MTLLSLTGACGADASGADDSGWGQEDKSALFAALFDDDIDERKEQLT